MNDILNLIDGKKTKIGIIAFFILGGLRTIEVIDQKTFEIAASFITAWTAYGLRDAITKIK